MRHFPTLKLAMGECAMCGFSLQTSFYVPRACNMFNKIAKFYIKSRSPDVKLLHARLVYKDFVRIIYIKWISCDVRELVLKACSNFPGSVCRLLGLRDRTEHIAQPLPLTLFAAEKLIRFRKRQKCVK